MAAESAKRFFSKKDESDKAYSINLQENRFTLSKNEFEKLAAPLIEKTLVCCRAALADAKLGIDKIDKIVLVGGSTRMPILKEAVEQFFQKKPFDELNPDEVVAVGAAIFKPARILMRDVIAN